MKVYTGMVIGESSKETDLEVNPVKQKGALRYAENVLAMVNSPCSAASNVRTVMKDDKVKISTPRILSVEEAMAGIRGERIALRCAISHDFSDRR